MRIETDGLVIREQTVGESDRLVTLLTRSAGILRGFARQAKTIRSAKASGTSLLCYSQFSVFKGRERVIIDDARPKESFFGLREDIARLALAQYFCELAGVLTPEESPAEDYLRLMLNALYFLSKNARAAAAAENGGGNADDELFRLYAGFAVLSGLRLL